MRLSEAALAIIERDAAPGEWLLLWNNSWQAYSLIGGHREEDESFRNCCLREVAEELKCAAGDVTVGIYPYVSLRFREFSHSARVETDYSWQVFVARVDAEVLNRLPPECRWATAAQIRAGRASDGRPIADQVRKVLKSWSDADFDLFVSYGHADNTDGSVTALVEHIRSEHERFVPAEPLKIFFDVWGIRDGDDWERRIYHGLIQSKTMLAVLSPAYFDSRWCRREYDEFIKLQMRKLYPGEAIHALYIHPHAEFENPQGHPHQGWFDDLQRRQFVDAKPWWPDGQQALQRDVVARRLSSLRESIWTRVCDARQINRTPSNLGAFNQNFVGREPELAEIWNTLRLDQAVAVSAIQGIGGLGKTALARAYAHTRRREYPGGQFEIAMENINSVDGVRLEIIQLANLYLGAGISDELVNQSLPAAFAQAKSVFERQGKILLILDNVAFDGLVSDRNNCLPSPEHVHVLATTRLDPELWGIHALRLESLSTADALDLFLKYRAFELPADETEWHRVRGDQETIDETQIDSDEWKAAVAIVNRLGGHALAVEIVAVYLGKYRTIRLSDYLQGLIERGLSLKLGQAGDDPAVKARLGQAIETNIGLLMEPTLARLETESPLALRALQWAALLPPDHVPLPWLRALLERDKPGAFDHSPDEPDPWQDGVVAQLLGWRILNGNPDDHVVRIHRIVQVAIEKYRAGPEVTEDQLLPFLESRAKQVNKDWGKVGVGWELSPLFETASLLIDRIGARTGLMVDRLLDPLRMSGRLLPALKLEGRVVGLFEQRSKSAPENADYARDLSVSYSKMGDLFRALGDGKQAREYYERALEVRQRLADSAPENADYARDLSVSYERMGDLFARWVTGNRPASITSGLWR